MIETTESSARTLMPNKRLTIALSADEYSAVKRFATRTDQTVSELVRQSLANSLAYEDWFRARVTGSLERLKEGTNATVSTTDWAQARANKRAALQALR
jgi:predicted transcriptional regulator